MENLCIFFLEKGEMVYLIVAIALTAFLVLYLLISSKRIIELKNQYDLLKEENEKLSQEQASKQQAVTDLTRKISECHLAIDTLDRDRRIATERAADAQEATVRLLKSEQERVATELKRVREVEE